MNLGIEIAVVVFNILYLLLIIRGKRVGWVFGVIGSALFVWANVTQHLYMDMLLNSYYVIIGCYGWWAWDRQGQTAPVTTMPQQSWFIILLITVSIILLLGYTMRYYTDNSMPYFDATVTVLSFLATWMAARRYIDNWYVWIVADPLAVVLYYMKGGLLYPLLFCLYTILAVYGYVQWRKEMKTV